MRTTNAIAYRISNLENLRGFTFEIMRRPALVFFVLLALLLPQPPAFAQQLVAPLKIGVFVNPPFVMKSGGQFTGIAIDLSQTLAAKLGWRYRFIEFKTIHDLVQATASGEIDLAVANLTISQSRAERVDFTQPWFDGGNRIMIASHKRYGFDSLIEGLSDAGFLKAYAWIGAIIMAATILLTFFDRHFDESFPRRWREGIAESFYTVMSVATSGKPPVRKNLFGWIGRIWQGIWLVCGIAILAYVTSSVTSVMTTLSLSGQISSLDDLSSKTVGVMSGTVQEDFAKSEGLRTRSYAGIDDAVEGLLNEEVAAIIHDAPVLEYYAHTHPNQPVDVVGRLFEKNKYGFALPRQSLLTRPLTIAVLGALDAGEIEKLRTMYFGEP